MGVEEVGETGEVEDVGRLVQLELVGWGDGLWKVHVWGLLGAGWGNLFRLSTHCFGGSICSASYCSYQNLRDQSTISDESMNNYFSNIQIFCHVSLS